MSLRALLSEVDPGWLEHAGTPLDPALAARAGNSALGRRLIGAWLAEGPASSLLAPDPVRDPGAIRRRWARPRLDALCRDIGILAHAPPIRAEVRREPVRRLRAAQAAIRALPPDRQRALIADFDQALAAAMASDDAAPLFAIFDRQGRSELRAWARRRDPPLADWCRLLHPPDDDLPAHLPEKPVLRVYTHHESRAA